MNEKEQRILELISGNPFISQNELAEKLGLSRPAVANYISSLIKKGEIIGRAYVLKKEGSIVCIGGANVDKKVVFQEKMQMHTSNPVHSHKTLGGVARNVAENLGRLGAKVFLLTAVGDDTDGKWLMDASSNWMDTSVSITVPSVSTGNYTALLDGGGEMVLALADMDIYNKVEFSQIDDRWNFIGAASYVFLDTNFPKEIIEKIIQKSHLEQIRLCVNLVSAPKAKKLPQNLNGIHLLIANSDEIDAVTKTGVKLEEKASELIGRGVENLIVTLGKEGLAYFSNSGEFGRLPALKVEVRDVTGAGDSMAAGVLYGLNRGLDLPDACRFGLVCSYITLQSDETVAPELNREKAETVFETFFEKLPGKKQKKFT